MTLSAVIVSGLWALLLLFWIVSAFGAKRRVGGTARRLAIRLIVAGLVVLAARLPVWHALPAPRPMGTSHPVLGIAGVLVCLLGMGLAIWARRCLGRNWGPPMSVQAEEPELVTSGPYAWVRHPIYTGFLLAMAGSALAVGVLWLVPCLGVGAFFLYSLKREEELMAARFPRHYPPYRQKTWALLPFVF